MQECTSHTRCSVSEPEAVRNGRFQRNPQACCSVFVGARGNCSFRRRASHVALSQVLAMRRPSRRGQFSVHAHELLCVSKPGPLPHNLSCHWRVQDQRGGTHMKTSSENLCSTGLLLTRGGPRRQHWRCSKRLQILKVTGSTAARPMYMCP